MFKNVKNTTHPCLLDLLAPHSCLGCGHLGTVLCDRCKKHILENHASLCPNCKAHIDTPDCPHCHNLPPIYTVGPRHQLLDDIIHDYKYNSTRALAPILAELLDKSLPEDLPKTTVIVPLPTSTKHIRERSLDHTMLLAKHLARRRGWRVERLLTRSKNTVQVGSDKSTRLSQADSAYKVSNQAARSDSTATYLLLDDVWTTGASMLAALKKLRAYGAEDVRIALLAYSVIS